MEESTSREKILKKIRNALIEKSDNPFPNLDFDARIYPEAGESIDVIFAREFTAIEGKFAFCENEQEVIGILAQLKQDLKLKEAYYETEHIKGLLERAGIQASSHTTIKTEAPAAVTSCEYLIARTGSIMVSSSKGSGRRIFAAPDVHIIIAYSSQLVYNISDALILLKKKYQDKLPSMLTMITGPSRTADIEKTLVMGAHGPKELYVLLLEDLEN